MQILIVDDERPARDKLRRLLEREADVSAIAEACDGVAALESIARAVPDVVFLDIQMPEITGLEVAASLPGMAATGQLPPLIVFVTAYDHYAIAAFDANAIDYLLKPFDQARLQRALQRVRERLSARKASAPAPVLVSESAPAPAPTMPYCAAGPIQNILVSERGVTRVLKVDDIQWLETADNYVVLHTSQARPLLRQTLTALLENIGPRFVRCHRRAAVQTASIDTIVAQGKGDYELVLKGGARVPCSRQYSALVLEQLAALGQY